MHKVLQADQALLSLSSEELFAITQLFIEACASKEGEPAFQKKYGVSREAMRAMLSSMNEEPHVARKANELVEAWADQGAVMIRVMNTYGDPVEMGETEAAEFAKMLRQAIQEAS
jgi:hypothetical protein